MAIAPLSAMVPFFATTIDCGVAGEPGGVLSLWRDFVLLLWETALQVLRRTRGIVARDGPTRGVGACITTGRATMRLGVAGL